MSSSTRSTKKDGVSLAKGPVALLGAVMLAYGIIAFLLGGNGFSASPPSGDVDGDTFLRIEGNGWTNLLWAAGGALLLFGSPFHRGAKSTALIVGLALGAASTIAIFDGFETGDVLGIFASNDWTILATGAASAYLLISALLPKVGKGRHAETHDDVDRDRERPVTRERDEPVHVPRGREREREVVAPASADRDTRTTREGEGRFDRARERESTGTGGGLTEDPQLRAARENERPR